MKFKYKRKVCEERDYWEECDIASLKKGDVFYMMVGNKEGPFLTAKSNATLQPSKIDDSKLIWFVETETMSDENFS